ncbi:hypothetical protein N7462_009423 [Penicillium macrosclerotiorum]|uniref:uncharacterized protein n=1 Tax=Penicillium macrosclerotiorum TaxID=303699 RepID=UPI00254931F9|nr:uncharacterized protein N7462_009423 [Penicillium macrosclerotiorum]KAJ5673984.1 hypothetical protein N7462_009423 [Penicillium macrosclerotiorum]
MERAMRGYISAGWTKYFGEDRSDGTRTPTRPTNEEQDHIDAHPTTKLTRNEQAGQILDPGPGQGLQCGASGGRPRICGPLMGAVYQPA